VFNKKEYDRKYDATHKEQRKVNAKKCYEKRKKKSRDQREKQRLEEEKTSEAKWQIFLEAERKGKGKKS
jgi:hypothetical protein